MTETASRKPGNPIEYVVGLISAQQKLAGERDQKLLDEREAQLDVLINAIDEEVPLRKSKKSTESLLFGEGRKSRHSGPSQDEITDDSIVFYLDKGNALNIELRQYVERTHYARFNNDRTYFWGEAIFAKKDGDGNYAFKHYQRQGGPLNEQELATPLEILAKPVTNIRKQAVLLEKLSSYLSRHVGD